MTHVLVLTSDPQAGALNEEIYRNLGEALAAEFGAAAPPRRLDRASAAEFAPREGAPERLAEFARALLGAAPVDVNVVPAEGRRKKLLVADMESTLIENEMLDDIAHLLGIGERVAAITRRAMNGELDFRAALNERVGLLEGQDAGLLERAAEGIRTIPGGAALARTMKADGALTAIVSGGFTFFTARVRQALGFERDYANTLLLDGAKLAGAVAEPILGREAKLATLERLAAELGISPRDTIAVGDGANDLAMLGAAGMGVAFRAKPVVAAQAKLRINHGDLTALLFLQGYTRDAFVT
ncbi:MAG: phosphoserine phosphatase SerB [Azospirillum sp.]|jgi:phosphoserine phosphatase|nr:phosphoserine phosphatase SerB [Azospirillum sp.]MCZ8122846.1 phosphoserine phosphatase SerB [Magnetospirillum sp.]